MDSLSTLGGEAVAGLSLEHIGHQSPVFEANEATFADQISNFSDTVVMDHLNSDVIAAYRLMLQVLVGM